MHCICMFEIQN